MNSSSSTGKSGNDGMIFRFSDPVITYDHMTDRQESPVFSLPENQKAVSTAGTILETVIMTALFILTAFISLA